MCRPQELSNRSGTFPGQMAYKALNTASCIFVIFVVWFYFASVSQASLLAVSHKHLRTSLKTMSVIY